LEDIVESFTLTIKSWDRYSEVWKWECVKSLFSEFEHITNSLDLVELLQEEALTFRHWKKLKDFMGCPHFSPDDKQSNGYFGKLYSLDLTKNQEIIREETEKAKKEFKIFQGLERIESEWKNLQVTVIPHKKKKKLGYYKIHKPQPIQEALEKHMMELSTFKTSVFAKAYS
jgi:hypothetical protein